MLDNSHSIITTTVCTIFIIYLLELYHSIETIQNDLTPAFVVAVADSTLLQSPIVQQCGLIFILISVLPSLDAPLFVWKLFQEKRADEMPQSAMGKIKAYSCKPKRILLFSSWLSQFCMKWIENTNSNMTNTMTRLLIVYTWGIAFLISTNVPRLLWRLILPESGFSITMKSWCYRKSSAKNKWISQKYA